MIESKTNHQQKRSTGTRVLSLVSGAVASLVAVGLLGLGAFALWGEGQKDERGYLSTDSHRFAASTHALATDNLDMDLDGLEGLVSSTDLGQVRLQVAPPSDEPLFVGIARTDDVSSYLGGVAHTEVTDLDYEPFEADYSTQAGGRKPSAPAEERFWAASKEGSGSQTLNWKVQDGDWSVVVMNADGSRGVNADISAGAKAPYLAEIGWGLVGGGAVFLLAALALVVLGVRAPRERHRAERAGHLAASAS